MQKKQLKPKKPGNYQRLMQFAYNETKKQPASAKRQRLQHRETNYIAAQQFEKETLDWLDKTERRGEARPEIRRELHRFMTTKAGKRRLQFNNSELKAEIEKITRMKNLKGSSNTLVIRDFHNSHTGDPLRAENAGSTPSLYIEKKKGDTNAKAYLREFAKDYRAYQKKAKTYVKAHGDYKGFNTGTNLIIKLRAMANEYPEVFSIGDMDDIVGTFKINQRNAAKYKDNMRFELDLRNIIGSSSISKEGVEWRKADIERHQNRLVAKYPAVGQVIQNFTAAGVDMDKLRQFVNSSSVVMYFFDYLAYDSKQVKKATIKLHLKLEQEATNPTTTSGGQLAYKPVNAKAFNDLLQISKSWTHTADTATYGPKFEQWFNEHLGDAYFL